MKKKKRQLGQTEDDLAKSLIDINVNKLDMEVVEHPGRVVACGRALHKLREMVAEKKADLDLAKEDMNYVEAILDRKVRIDPAEYGIKCPANKVTEKMVHNAVLIQKRYRAALLNIDRVKRELIKLERQEGELETQRRGFEHRKQCLNNAVTLFLNDFFAEVELPRSTKRFGESREDAEINSAMKRRRRREEDDDDDR